MRTGVKGGGRDDGEKHGIFTVWTVGLHGREDRGIFAKLFQYSDSDHFRPHYMGAGGEYS